MGAQAFIRCVPSGNLGGENKVVGKSGQQVQASSPETQLALGAADCCTAAGEDHWEQPPLCSSLTRHTAGCSDSSPPWLLPCPLPARRLCGCPYDSSQPQLLHQTYRLPRLHPSPIPRKPGAVRPICTTIPSRNQTGNDQSDELRGPHSAPCRCESQALVCSSLMHVKLNSAEILYQEIASKLSKTTSLQSSISDAGLGRLSHTEAQF